MKTLSLLFILLSTSAALAQPNILWLFSEDNSSYLGCYGDPVARTPNIDKLAAKGIRYINCFANAPVCAVARSSIILGVPAVTTGTHNMRSKYKVPSSFTPYPTLLREAGYYCTNQVKTDYNTSSFDKEIWDACSGKAHYSKRPDKSQPFFAKINLAQSHESKIFPDKRPETLKTKAEDITVPPYQIDNPETRADWQALYDRLEDMDTHLGKILQGLEKSGELEDTIVLYSSDHGGITIRSKRYLYDSGTRVPFIAYFPDKWKHLAPKGCEPGKASDRLLQFIDFPKTILSLANAEIPAYMPGKIFAGKNPEAAPEKVFLFSNRFDETQDMSRGISDGRYKYIRNFEPDRKSFQLLSYPLKQLAQQAHYNAFKAGLTNPVQSKLFQSKASEEFFDTQSDPHEIHNLIESPEHAECIASFRADLDQKIIKSRDLGFLPEPVIEAVDKTETTIYEWAQSEEGYPLEEILALANLASLKKAENIDHFVEELSHENAIVRYWASLGLRVLIEKAAPAKEALLKAAGDEAASVRITALMALGNIDDAEGAALKLIDEAKGAEEDIHSAWALSAAKYLEYRKGEFPYKKHELTKGPYSMRAYSDLEIGKTLTEIPAVYFEK